MEWTGATDLAAALGPGYGYRSTLVIDDPADVAILRALRAADPLEGFLALRQGDVSFYTYVVDVIPHTNERGRLRPPFPIREGPGW